MSDPKPIKMLKVEEPVKPIDPLPTDTTEKPEPVTTISPERIEPTPRSEGGESGSSPLRSVTAGLFTRLKG